MYSYLCKVYPGGSCCMTIYPKGPSDWFFIGRPTTLLDFCACMHVYDVKTRHSLCHAVIMQGYCHRELGAF